MKSLTSKDFFLIWEPICAMWSDGKTQKYKGLQNKRHQCKCSEKKFIMEQNCELDLEELRELKMSSG